MNYHRTLLITLFTTITLALLTTGCAGLLSKKITAQRVEKHCEQIDYAEVDVVPVFNPNQFTTFRVYEFAPCLGVSDLIKVTWKTTESLDVEFGNKVLQQYLGTFYPTTEVNAQLLAMSIEDITVLLFDVSGLHKNLIPGAVKRGQ